MYIIKGSPTTNSIKLAEDSKSVDINFTLLFNLEGETKLPDASVGDKVNLSLETGERSTMVEELNEKINEWFQTNYNLQNP